jgi:RNA polymerase sigma-70 factor (ECF subfamily)
MCDLPCRCGDFIADLAHDHVRRLAAIARREGAPADDALDIVQDAFFTLLARPDLEALRERPAEAAYVLSTITRNAARNLRRRHRNARPHVDIDAEPIAGDDARGDILESAQLAGCLAQLGEVQRRVVTLRVLEELSGDDAAAAVGLSPNHVAVLLYRARKELAACMEA